jgi:hypothetical protein
LSRINRPAARRAYFVHKPQAGKLAAMTENAHTKDESGAARAHQPGAPADPFLSLYGLGLAFWARRAHAYGDYLEDCAQGLDPARLIGANTRFFARMQSDYVKAFAALTQLSAPAPQPARKTERAAS